MLCPNRLEFKDNIYILSTARYISQDEIQDAISWISQLGYNPIVGKTVGYQDNQYAGTDEDRLQEFQSALNNPNIAAIWFARGGYGSVRILDKVDWTEFLNHPKWLIGFSDITIWHNQVNQFLAVQSLHAIMPSTFNINTDQSKEYLIEILKGNKPKITFEQHSQNSNQKEVSGELIGGNLSILNSLLGTDTGWNTKGRILFIEEVDEYLYHIDRMIISLKKSGKFSGLNGLLVGGFTEIKDNTVPFGKSYIEIINEHVAPYNIPVFFGVPSGHIENNLPLILGSEIRVIPSDNQVTIEYL